MPRAFGHFSRAYAARTARFYPTLYTDQQGNPVTQSPWRTPEKDVNPCPPLVPPNEPADFDFIYDPIYGSKIVRIARKTPAATQAA